jgi:cell division protein FtsB
MKRQVFKWLTNKYILAGIGFLMLLLFNDRSSIFDYLHYKEDLEKVKKERDYYKQETARINTEYDEVFGSTKKLEKFAREKYFMKRDSEDIYIIVPESN